MSAFLKLSTAQKTKYVKALTTVVKVQDYSTSQSVSYAHAKKGSKIHSRTVKATCDWKPGKYFPSILKFHDTVSYRVKGKKVLKTTSSDNYVLSNYNPFVSLKKPETTDMYLKIKPTHGPAGNTCLVSGSMGHI